MFGLGKRVQNHPLKMQCFYVDTFAHVKSPSTSHKWADKTTYGHRKSKWEAEPKKTIALKPSLHCHRHLYHADRLLAVCQHPCLLRYMTNTLVGRFLSGSFTFKLKYTSSFNIYSTVEEFGFSQRQTCTYTRFLDRYKREERLAANIGSSENHSAAIPY